MSPAAEPLAAGEFGFDRTDFAFIATTLYEDAGISLPASKANLVYSRLAKRLRALGLESFRDYCELVGSEEGTDERTQMIAALTTNVTRFFREPHHFDHLRRLDDGLDIGAFHPARANSDIGSCGLSSLCTEHAVTKRLQRSLVLKTHQAEPTNFALRT